jgi:hypothetical protein
MFTTTTGQRIYAKKPYGSVGARHHGQSNRIGVERGNLNFHAELTKDPAHFQIPHTTPKGNLDFRISRPQFWKFAPHFPFPRYLFGFDATLFEFRVKVWGFHATFGISA